MAALQWALGAERGPGTPGPFLAPDYVEFEDETSAGHTSMRFV
jgi:hypothetical protein